ncbi:MAG: hypothetical protein NW226_12340 [Microscillaceae bacterium]|nr:hypothetical protein [Microscillaceae bacterium]
MYGFLFVVCERIVKEQDWKSLNQAGMQAYQASNYPKAKEIYEKAGIQEEQAFGMPILIMEG